MAPTITGIIFSGNGEGARFVHLPWVSRQILEKLGFTPYPGTLNIGLTQDCSIRLMKTLNRARPIEILPSTGFYRGKCFRSIFMDSLECAIIVPGIAGYPNDIVEVVAPINLRESFKLENGDAVRVRLML